MATIQPGMINFDLMLEREGAASVPLIDASMLYLKIAEFMFNIVREVLSMLIQGVQLIMDIIPF